jgi:hypothetical protein
LLNLKGLSRKTKIAAVGGIGAVLLLAQVTNVDWPTQVKNRPNITRTGSNATWTDNVTMSGTNLFTGSNTFTGTSTNIFNGTNTFSTPIVASAYSVSTRGDRWISLQNPDFEGSSLIPPPGWAIFQTPTLSYETVSPAPNKVQSLKVVTAAGPGAGVVSSTLFSIQNGQGEQFVVSGWVKSDGVVSCALELDYRNKNGVVLDILQASSSSSSWTYVSAQGFSPPGSIYANYFNYQVTNSAGTCWFDKNSVLKTLIPGQVDAFAYSRYTHVDRSVPIENPDFENSYSPAGQPVIYQEIPPAGWGFNNTPHGTITYDTSTPYTGKTRSIKIVSDGVTANQGIYQVSLFSALPGDSYNFSVAIKSDGTANAQAQINWYDKSFNFLGGCFLNRTANTWAVLNTPCTVPASAIQGQVILNNPGMSGTIEFDMVSLQRTNYPGQLTAAAYVASTHGDRQIILANPDFEVSSILPPPGWTLTGAATLSYETVSPAPGKNQSLKVVATASFSGVLSGTFYSVIPGDTYNVSCLVKSDGTAQAACVLLFLDKNGSIVNSVNTSGSTSTSWVAQTASGVAAANVVQAVMKLQNNAATGTDWYDEIVVQKVTLPTVPPSCTTLQKTETAADPSLLICAIPAQAGTYRINFAMLVSAANTATIGWSASWTDSGGNGQAPTNLPLFQNGTALPAFTFNGVADYWGSAIVDVNNAGGSITVKVTFSGTSFTAKATAIVERIN